MLAAPEQPDTAVGGRQLRRGAQARDGRLLPVVGGAQPHDLGQPPQVVPFSAGDEGGVQGRLCGAEPAVPCQQVGEQRQPVRHAGERARCLEVGDALPGQVDARLVRAGPAVQDQPPLAVVGKAVPAAQLAQLADRVPQLGHIVAHLVGDGAIGQGHGQAVRVVDRPGQFDGLVTGGQGLGVVAEQPVGVCRPGRAVHIGPGADAQPDGTARQLGGELKVTQPLGRHPQADGRPADSEMSRTAQLGAGVDQGQRAGGRLVPISDAPLNELRRPERDQAGERGVFAAQ